MRLIVDSKACAKHQLNVNEFLLLHLIMQGQDCKDIIETLKKRGILQEQNGKCVIPELTKNVVNSILVECGNIDSRNLDTLAVKMQRCFPEGKPSGGIAYYRANKREIVFQLQKFFFQYGNYSDEDIIAATKRFVDSFNGNYKYLPVITNFILKSTKTLDEFGNPVVKESSQLASQLENKQQEEETGVVAINDDSWLFNTRN